MSHFDISSGEWVPDPGDGPTPSLVPPAAAPVPPVAPTPPPFVAAAGVPPVAPVKPAAPGLEVMQQTITGPSTTGKVATKDVLGAAADVTKANNESHDAIAAEEKNNLLKADIEGKNLELEHAAKIKAAEEASRELARREAFQQRLQQKVDSDVAREQDEYRRNQRGFFGDTESGGGFAKQVLWGLAMGFNAAANGQGNYNNTGFRLLDKAMDRWTHEREQSLAFLSKKAQASGGALADWIEKFGPQAENTLKLKQAAAYAGVADQIRDQVEKQKTLLTETAKTQALAKAAEYDQKAAERKQQVALAMAPSYHSGNTTTTMVDPSVKNPNKPEIDVNIYGPNGQPIARAKTPKQAEEANKANQAYASLDGLLKDLHDSYAKHGKYVNPLGDVSSSREAIRGAAVVAFKNAAQLGALSGPDMGLIEQAISGGYTAEQAMAKLASAREAMKKANETKLATLGLSGSDVTKAWSKQGGVKQVRTRPDGKKVSGTLYDNGSFEED